MILSTHSVDSEVIFAVKNIIRNKLLLGCSAKITVTGKSMGFSLPQESVVTVQRESTKNLKVGDIVVIAEPNRLLIHRLKKKINQDGEVFLVTQGDATYVEDAPVNNEGYLGKIYEYKWNNKTICLNRFSGKMRDRLNYFLTKVRKLFYFCRKEVRHFIILQQKNRFVHAFSKACYLASIQVATFVLKRMPEVHDVILYRSVAHDDWIPGLSDIDLWVVINTDGVSCEQQSKSILKVSSSLKRMRKWIPLLDEGIVSTGEFLEDWKKYGGLRAQEVSRWRSLIQSTPQVMRYQFNTESFAWDCLNELQQLLQMMFVEVKSLALNQQGEPIFRIRLKKQLVDFYRMQLLWESKGKIFLNRREFKEQNPSHPILKYFQHLDSVSGLLKFKYYSKIYDEFNQDLDSLLFEISPHIPERENETANTPQQHSSYSEFLVATQGKDGLVLLSRRSLGFFTYLRELHRLAKRGGFGRTLLILDETKWAYVKRGVLPPNNTVKLEARWSYAVISSLGALAQPNQPRIVQALSALRKVSDEDSSAIENPSLTFLLREIERVRSLTNSHLSGNFY